MFCLVYLTLCFFDRLALDFLDLKLRLFSLSSKFFNFTLGVLDLLPCLLARGLVISLNSARCFFFGLAS